MATYTRIFRNRSLVVIGLSESISNIGNWITMMAVFAMVVFQGNGSVTQSSGVFLAGLLPTLLFSPAAGWLCDRFDRKWLMILSELVSGLIVAGLVFTRQLELIYILLAIQAISISIMTPARQSVVPDIIGNEDLTQANAFLQQLNGIVKIGAPVLAGFLLTFINPHQAIILDVISFVISAAILSRLPSLPAHLKTASQKEETSKPASDQGILEVLKSSSQLQILFGMVFLAIILFVGFDILSPVFIRDILKGNEGLFGTLIGCIGAGTLISTIGLMLLHAKHNPWLDILSGLGLLTFIPACMVLAARLSPSPSAILIVIAGCLVGGAGNGLINVQIITLMQQLSPSEMLGRMGGIFQSTATGGQLAGIVLTPLLVPALFSMEAYFSAATMAALLLLGYTIFTLVRTHAIQTRPQVSGD